MLRLFRVKYRKKTVKSAKVKKKEKVTRHTLCVSNVHDGFICRKNVNHKTEEMLSTH